MNRNGLNRTIQAPSKLTSGRLRDHQPIAELPYVGPLLPGYDNSLVATGFDKWGADQRSAAALALMSRILGGRMEWATAFSSWSRHGIDRHSHALRTNSKLGINLAAAGCP